MADKKIIAVMGATGAQGGGLVRAILDDPAGGFAARAITRDVNSAKARRWRGAGAEVVAARCGRCGEPGTGVRGAYGAFCVTFYWDHFSPEKELAQAAALAQAAKGRGVQHVIWSTLEDTRQWVPLSDNRMPTLMGKYKVPHFDAKGEAESLFTDAAAGHAAADFVLLGQLHLFRHGSEEGAGRKVTLTLPMGDKKLPGIAAEDIGRCAYGIFQQTKPIRGEDSGDCGRPLTGAEMAAAFSKALGHEVVYQAVPFDVYRGFGFPGADDLGNMFQFKHDFNEMYCAARDLDFSRSLNPGCRRLSSGWVQMRGRSRSGRAGYTSGLRGGPAKSVAAAGATGCLPGVSGRQ